MDFDKKGVGFGRPPFFLRCSLPCLG